MMVSKPMAVCSPLTAQHRFYAKLPKLSRRTERRLLPQRRRVRGENLVLVFCSETRKHLPDLSFAQSFLGLLFKAFLGDLRVSAVKCFSRAARQTGDHMRFGITIKPDMPVERIVRLTRQAEAAGFEYGWIFDSHVLWLEPYPMLTLMAANTKNMRLGTCVTNPATRDITVTSSLFATLNLISGGRMQLGIGRGDSSRRVLGKKPVTVAQLEESIKDFRNLTSASEIDYEG